MVLFTTNEITEVVGSYKGSLPTVRLIFFQVRDICKHNHNIICLHLSEEIKRRVKNLGLRRYKFVVMVTIGENKQQGFNMATKFFWDEQLDGFVSESHEIDGSFIVAVVYGIYTM